MLTFGAGGWTVVLTVAADLMEEKHKMGYK